MYVANLFIGCYMHTDYGHIYINVILFLDHEPKNLLLEQCSIVALLVYTTITVVSISTGTCVQATTR
jgi:hypothetical protein